VKPFVCSAVLVLLLAVPRQGLGQAAEKTAPSGNVAGRHAETGVEISTEAPGKAAKGKPKCTLTVAPSPSTNGAAISFSVAYSPCLTAARIETFTFPWASNLATFGERTVRQKLFKAAGGCVSSSFDSTIVPTALAIKGKFEATVVVRNPAGGVICTAKAPFEVN
jgi:hypothetical protein